VNNGIIRIDLHNFRNYAHLRCNIDSACVVLTGNNGAGKTNILEAISLFAPGRGIRHASTQDVLQHGQPDWSVALKLQVDAQVHDIGTGITPTQASKRILRYDGQSIRSYAPISELMSIIWMTPLMDGLWIGPPEERRRFLDRFVSGCDPLHTDRLHRYAYTLRQRSTVLTTQPHASDWLDSLEATLAEDAVAIAAARQQTVQILNHAICEGRRAFPQAELSINGDLESQLQDGSALAAEDWLRQQLQHNRGIDAQLGGARAGAHRSDVMARHLEKNQIASDCSTGEQKAVLVSIILAYARIQTWQRPGVCVLLLDDIVAYLDLERRETLFEELAALRVQAWLSGTDASLFMGLQDRAQFLKITNGSVRV
jgi:DNA replication and repair protein RecF